MPEAIIEAEKQKDTAFDKLDRVIAGIEQANSELGKSMHSGAALVLLQSAARTEDVGKVADYFSRYTRAMTRDPVPVTEPSDMVNSY